jgi:hypothetical protein
VDFAGEATLLHPLATNDGGASEVTVERVGERSFRLSPYPFDAPQIGFQVAARFVPGLVFASSEELQQRFDAAAVEALAVTVTA